MENSINLLSLVHGSDFKGLHDLSANLGVRGISALTGLAWKDCIKTAIQQPNTVVLPVNFTGKEYDDDPDCKDVAKYFFLGPILAKVYKITIEEAKKMNFYNRFKYDYFEPILKAEYNRMASDNLNYFQEKPFIICAESSVSRMVSDERLIPECTAKVLRRAEKELKKYNLVVASIMNKDDVSCFSGYKLTDYFTFENCTGLGKSGKDLEYVKDSDTKCIVNTKMNSGYLSIISSVYIKTYIFDYIREKILEDMVDSFNCENETISKIQDELAIFNSRTANVFSEYLTKFNKEYDSDEYDINKLLISMICNVNTTHRDEYMNIISTIESCNLHPMDTIITNALTKTYLYIGQIESFNKDCTESNPKVGCDSAKLHSLFEGIVLECKKFNIAQNLLYHQIVINRPFGDKPKESELFVMTKDIITILYSYATELRNKDHSSIAIDDKTIKNLFKSKLDAEFSKIVFKKSNDRDKMELFYKTCIDFVTKTCRVISNCKAYRFDFDEEINKWREMIRKNAIYFSKFDPICELENYFFSDACLCSANYVRFEV